DPGFAGGSTQVITLPPNTTSYPDTGRALDTKYYYRVRATNNGSNSPYSNTVSQLTVPTAPVLMAANAVSQTEIDLTWTDTSQTETGFTVEISTDGSNFSPAGTTLANVTTLKVTGLNADTLYYF